VPEDRHVDFIVCVDDGDIIVGGHRAVETLEDYSRGVSLLDDVSVGNEIRRAILVAVHPTAAASARAQGGGRPGEASARSFVKLTLRVCDVLPHLRVASNCPESKQRADKREVPSRTEVGRLPSIHVQMFDTEAAAC